MATVVVMSPSVGEGQVRVSEPRIQPLTETDAARWSAEVRDGIEAFGVEVAAATPFLLTLARHPPALKGLGPLAKFIRRDSMVTAVDQALLGLRAAWLSESDVLWAEGVAAARELGLSDDDVRRVAEGPDAGWGRWDAIVIRAADELYRDSFLSDATWAAMAERYNAQQMIDVIFTVAEYVMLSMMSNSFGVQPGEQAADRLPHDVPRSMGPTRPTPVRLETARLGPVPMAEWTDEQRELLDPGGTGRPTLNLFMTLARHPVLYRARGAQSRYIRTESTLSGRVREMLILRMGWLCGAEYEWAQHAPFARREGMTDEEIRDIAVGPSAPRWTPFEAALLQATDELHRDDMISDATWAVLAQEYGQPELIDTVITVAGYRLVSMAINSLGTQLESDVEPPLEGFPDVPR